MTSLRTPLIIGHRGASAIAPENTLAAFQQAIDDGADGIEFDVRLSRDNVPVVIHDASLKRTCLLNAAVSELTVAELQRVNAGAFFKSAQEPASFHPVPTLAQLFELFAHAEGLLYLEMKGEPVTDTLIKCVIEVIDSHDIARRVIVECFDHRAITSLKGLAPHLRTAALFESRIRQPANLFGRRVLAAALATNADELALHHTLVTDRLVLEAKDRGLDVVVWTVDETKWLERARRLGIKSLITNNPANMLAHRS